MQVLKSVCVELTYVREVSGLGRGWSGKERKPEQDAQRSAQFFTASCFAADESSLLGLLGAFTFPNPPQNLQVIV